jgi:hypothetical protein
MALAIDQIQLRRDAVGEESSPRWVNGGSTGSPSSHFQYDAVDRRKHRATGLRVVIGLDGECHNLTPIQFDVPRQAVYSRDAPGLGSDAACQRRADEPVLE